MKPITCGRKPARWPRRSPSMALLPLVEIVLRATLHVGISGAASFTQHLTLVVGMLGAAVAAREGRLAFPVHARFAARRAQRAAGALLHPRRGGADRRACSAWPASSSCSPSARGGNVIAYGVPVWIGQAVLPLGFALITLRLAWSAADSWAARAATLVLAGLVGAGCGQPPAVERRQRVTAIMVVLVAAILGSPVFARWAGWRFSCSGTMACRWRRSPLDHYRLVVNPSLPTIPLFTLAGYFLAEGGAPRRLVRVFNALFGRLRGGAALVTVLAVRVLHLVLGRVGRHHPRARRHAHAAAKQRGLFTKERARPPRRRRLARRDAAAGPAAGALRHRGEDFDRGDVPRRHPAGAPDGGADRAMGSEPCTARRGDGAPVPMA